MAESINLTPEQRQVRAKNAARARWDNRMKGDQVVINDVDHDSNWTPSIPLPDVPVYPKSSTNTKPKIRVTKSDVGPGNRYYLGFKDGWAAAYKQIKIDILQVLKDQEP